MQESSLGHTGACKLTSRCWLACRPVYGDAMRAPRVLEGASLLFQAEAYPAAEAYMPLLPEDFLVSSAHAVGRMQPPEPVTLF